LGKKKRGRLLGDAPTVEKVAQPLFQEELHERVPSIFAKLPKNLSREMTGFHFIPPPAGGGTPCGRAFLTS